MARKPYRNTVNKSKIEGSGRKKGTPNKATALLKDAILQAAHLSGRDQKGKDGLVGYCRRLADDEPKAFCGLLGKVLPTQVIGGDGGPVEHSLVIQYVTAPK
jgi:hypothetical protein